MNISINISNQIQITWVAIVLFDFESDFLNTAIHIMNKKKIQNSYQFKKSILNNKN